MAEFTNFVPNDTSPLGAVAPAAQNPTRITSADVVRIAKEEGADPQRALAHWKQESSSGTNATTSANGARGGFQLMPGTFRSVMGEGYDIDNPEHNARAGARLIKQNQDRYPNNPDAQVAAYFTNPKLIDQHGGDVSKMGHIKDANGVSVPDYVRGVLGKQPQGGFTDFVPDQGPGSTAPTEQASNGFTGFMPDEQPAAPSVPGADQESPGLVSDTGNLLGQGAAQAVQGVVYAANKATDGWIDKFSEEHLGIGLNQIVADVNQHYADKLSPAMQAAAQEEWISSKPDETFGDAWKDPRAYYNIVVSSLPATIATLGPAGLAAKFAAQTAFRASLAKSVALKLTPQAAQAAAENAAIKAATYAAVATGGAVEGIIAGGQQGQQVEDSIAKLPDSVIEQAPAYQKALTENKGDRAKARAAVMKDAGTQTLWQVGVSTAILGAGFDGYVGAQIAKRMTRGGSEMTRMMEALHGAAVEVPTEFSQGFAEQYLSNLAQKEHANPQQNMMEGVMNNAVGSAVAAGPTGLGFGAMTGGGHKPTAVPPAAPPAAQPAEPEPQAQAAPAEGAPAPVETAAPSKEEVEKAASFTDTNPTAAEKKNGKYDKGVVDFHGLQISIENPKGSERSGTSAAGKAWSITMPHHYGEIEGTVGTDGDKVDVFIGPHPDSERVFVVDQIKSSGEHDEYKVMVGFQSARAAKKGYMDAYEKGWTGLGSMRQMSIPELKAAIASGKLNKNAQAVPSNEVPASPASTAPAAETAAPVQPVESQEGGTPQPEGESNAVTEGQQQSSGEQEHLGTPSGENVPGDGGEIRGGPSEQTGGGNRTERGGAEQPSPEGRTPAAPEAPVQVPADALNAVGYWEGPNGEFEETTEKPSLAERARELALHDRRWYAAKPLTREQRLEAVAKIYDSIGDATRAANVRRKIAETAAAGEDLDTLERVAETAQRVHENQGGTTVTGGEAIPAGPKAPPEVSSEPRSPPVAPPAQPKPPKESPKEPKAPREPKAPKPPKETPKPEEPKAPPAPPKEKAQEDTVAKMIAERNGDALTKHIYEAAQIKTEFEDGVTVLDEGILEMSVALDKQKAIEGVMKKMGFRITDRAKEGTESKRIELYAMYKPEKGDIQDTGIIGGKPANQGGEKPLPEPKGDVEQDIDALNESAKIADHFTIDRPEATFGTMLFLEAIREKLKTFLQFAGPGFGGSEGNSSYGKSLKQALIDTAKTPEGMQLVREQAIRYIGMLAKLEELTKGTKNVTEARDAIFNAGWEIKGEWATPKKQGSEWNKIGLQSGNLDYYFKMFQENENTIDQTNRIVKKDPKVPPRLENVIRVGMKDFRKGQNVNEDSFKVKFGFRDVEFGEWVNQVERQENLNLAYDSLMDMAAHLEIDPKFVGLNGTLGLSFGSRGAKISKAAAHFEFSGEGGAVINLTKTKGNGTVSHEWMHALEHHILGIPGGQRYVSGLRDILQTYWDLDQMEPRVLALLSGENAYGAARNQPPKDRAIAWLKSEKKYEGWEYQLTKSSQYQADASAMDGKGDAYYKKPEELVARAEEAYLFDKVKGGSPYLVGPMVRDGAMTRASGYKGTAYPTGKERVRFAQDYKNFFDGLEFGDEGIRLKSVENTPYELRRKEGQAKAAEIADRIDKIMEEMGLKQHPEIKNGSMVESMFYHLKNGWFPENARDLLEWVAQAHRVTNDDIKSNLLLQKAGQEDFEAALGQFAAQRITDWRMEGRDQKGIFDGLIELYRKQPKLNIRTSTSSSLQQYSTPLPIAYIAGLLARVQEKSVVYEPTAGNGLLAITATAKNVIANELEAHRALNLKLLGFPRVTTEDAVKAQDAKVFKTGEADVVLANPPFGKLESPALVDGYQVTRIDQLIVGRSLPAMFDKGRAVLLIGANKVPGEINSREHPFFNWLYSHYNVASHFEFDGDFYERQGAAWPIRVITIAGRARSNNVAPKSGTIPRVSYNSAKAQESYDELWRQYESSKRDSESILTGNVGSEPATGPGSRPGGANTTAVPAGGPGETDQVTGGSGPATGKGRGPVVPGGGRELNPPGGLPGRVGGADAGNGAGVDVGVVGGPGQRGPGEPGTVTGGAGAATGAEPGNVPGGSTGLEGVTAEDIDRIFNGDPVLVADPKTGAPEESDTGPKKPPTGPRGGGGKPISKSKSGVTAVERALGIDLSNEFAEIGKIIGDPENGGSMFSRKLYEDALGTVDATIYQQLKGVFDRIWATIRSKISDATRALIEFKNIVASRFGQSVERINNYAKVYVLDKMYPADRALTKSDEGKDNLHQVVYNGKSQGENLGILVPRNQAAVLERALDKLEDKIQDEHHDIDAFVQKELGYASTAEMYKALSGYQIDNVALVIDQIKQGRGIIIGDATGVGKGRQAAALIWWSIKNGKIPVFMSFKDDLYSDMYRDLINIGHPEVAPLLTNTDGVILDPRDESGKKKLFANNKETIKAQIKSIAETGKLPAGRNALFTSYAQINTENTRRAALAAILKSGNSVMIMDESHNASGESGVGEWMMNVFNNYSPPVVYLSATYAKRTDNMPIYMRTNLGMLSQDPQELIAMLSAGGPQMQSVLAQMLVEDGQMSRREKDMSMLKVKFLVDDENLVKDTRLADEATEALRAIVRADRTFYEWFQKNHDAMISLLPSGSELTWGKGTNSHTAQQLKHGLFTSVVHNFVKQLSLSIKADNAVGQIVASLNRNEKPVIPLENTMEAALNYYIEANKVSQGDSMAGYGWKTVLLKALDRRRSFTYKDPTGVASGRYEVPFSMMPPNVQRTFTEALDVIQKFETPLSASPIDYMRSKLAEYGWYYTGKKDENGVAERKYVKQSEAKGQKLTTLRVGEITGRKNIIDYSGESPVLGNRNKEQDRSIHTVREFNAGQLDALFLNSSGSTGISLHASEEFRDQRKRFMLVLQAAGDISVFQQTLGRVHRTGQVVTPDYTVLATALPSEKRPMAVLKKKMTNLLSNTTSGQESATDVDALDFINMYGDEAVTEYLREHSDVAEFIGEDMPDQGNVEGIALTASGRIALLPVAEQKSFYDQVEHGYNAIITMKNEAGTNKLIVRTLDTKAIEQQEQELTGGSGESIFNSPSFLAKYSIQVQGERPKPEEVKAALKEALTNKDGTPRTYIDIIREIEEARQAPFEQAKSAELNRIEGAGGLAEKLNEKDISPAKHRDITAQIASIKKKMALFDQVKLSTKAQLQVLKVGYGARLALENGELPFGTIIGIKSNLPATGNPWSPSNFVVNFMINNENRRASIPLSKIARDNVIDQELRRVQDNDIDFHYKLRTGETAGERPREDRHFVVGNIPAGFEAVHLAGDVVSFTMADGSVRTGLMMPRNFNPGAVVDQNLFVSNLSRYGEQYADGIYDYLTALSREGSSISYRDRQDIAQIGVQSKDNVIRIVGEDARDTVELIVQRSGGGKKIAENQELVKITGELAAAPKQPFRVTVSGAEAIKAMIKFIAKRKALYVSSAQVPTSQKYMAKYEKRAEPTAFSRGHQVAEPAAVWEVQQAVNKLLSKWADAPPVEVVKSIADLPPEVRAQIEREGADDVGGVFHAGKVYLVAANLSAKDAQVTLVHEVKGHYGLRKTFGKGLASILDQVATARSAQVNALLKAQGMPNTPEARARAAEEVLAIMAQGEPTLGFVRRAVAAIKSWLREKGLLSASNLSDDEIIRNFILPAARTVERGPPNNLGANEDNAQNSELFSKSAVYSRTSELFDALTKSDSKVGLWSRTVGTQFNLAKSNPAFRQVFERGQDFLSDIWRHATAAEKMAPNWFKRGWLQGISRKDADAASQFLLHGTLLDKVWSDDQLARGVNVKTPEGDQQLSGLTPQQIKMYHEAHAAIRVSLETQAKAFMAKASKSIGVRIDKEMSMDDMAADIQLQLGQRIAEAKGSIDTLEGAKPEGYSDQVEQLKAAVRGDQKSIAYIEELVGHVNKLSDEGYFPLSRFGTHFVAVYRSEKDYSEGNAAHFSLHDGLTKGLANSKANLEAQRMRKTYPNAFKIETGIISKDSFRMYDGLNLDALELFAKHLGMDKDELFQEGYRELFASRSLMKRLIHRKGVPGYSKDAYRGLADFIMTTARATSASENFPEMMKAISDIREGDVKDHAIALYEYLKDPVEEAHKLRGYLFFHFIGGSLASALTNLTQTPLVTAPFLSKYVNPAAVTARMAAAAKDAVKDPFAKNLRGEFVHTGQLWDDLRKAEEDGTTAAQEIFQMMGVASGSKLAGNKYAESFLKAWGAMFGYAETFNRRVAYIAAHNIAESDSALGDPHKFAENAVFETQFLYNKGNRPVWGRGQIGSTMFTFKQFNINVLELLHRMPLQQKIYMMFLLMLAAGVEGLPFAEDLEDLIDTIGQRFPELGVTTNSKKWLDKTARKVFGQFLGNAFVQGLPSAASPFDVSQRLSMGNLIPGTAFGKVSETDKFRDVRDLVGPAAGLVYGAFGGLEDLLKGNYLSAAKKAAPTAVQNLVKGTEMAATGEAKDTRGQFVTKVGVGEAIGKAAGLNPNKVAEIQRVQRNIKTDENLIQVMKSDLLDQYVNAIINHRQDDINAISKKIMAWNKSHPDMPIVMSPSAIRNRIALARMSGENRLIKQAPKPLRGDVAEQLRGIK